MNTIRVLQNAVDYIEENLDNQFELDSLASKAYLSPFYFHRLFSKAANMTVFSYIKKRRLTIAARMIADDNDITITEIANRVGYVNYEQFSRDFKSEFCITPIDYKKSKTPIVFTPKPDFNLMTTMVDEDETVVFDEMSIAIKVAHLDEIHVAGISKLCGLTGGIDDPGVLWGYFHANNLKDKIPNQPEKKVEFGLGISNHVEDGSVHGFTYIAGCQVLSQENVPEEYSSFTVPAGLYAICRVEAETFDLLVNEVMYKAGNYMMNKWMPENGKYAFKGEIAIEKYYPTSEDGSVFFDYCFPVVEL